MPDFDLDAALTVPPAKACCQHCGGVCLYSGWDADEHDWSVLRVEAHCADCDRLNILRYAYAETLRLRDRQTTVVDRDVLSACECPFCRGAVDGWGLHDGATNLQMAIIDRVTKLSGGVYIEVHCEACASYIRECYQFEGYLPPDEGDWEMVIPDVDRRVLAPDNGQPEED